MAPLDFRDIFFGILFGSALGHTSATAERIGETLLYVLPNPSGLNAHFQVPDYSRMFCAMGRLVGRGR